MKPSPWDWDYLIHRHLEGGLTVEQFQALNRRLEEDAALRRRLAELAFERAVLCVPATEALGSASAPLLKPAAPRKAGRRARRKNRKSEGGGHDLN